MPRTRTVLALLLVSFLVSICALMLYAHVFELRYLVITTDKCLSNPDRIVARTDTEIELASGIRLQYRIFPDRYGVSFAAYLRNATEVELVQIPGTDMYEIQVAATNQYVYPVDMGAVLRLPLIKVTVPSHVPYHVGSGHRIDRNNFTPRVLDAASLANNTQDQIRSVLPALIDDTLSGEYSFRLAFRNDCLTTLTITSRSKPFIGMPTYALLHDFGVYAFNSQPAKIEVWSRSPLPYNFYSIKFSYAFPLQVELNYRCK